uniref:Uncharacterized protein n=1 Tax=Heterorhabditis bacteriophora TaxID=37862 RepID=A0A1I7WNV5_HETBA
MSTRFVCLKIYTKAKPLGVFMLAAPDSITSIIEINRQLLNRRYKKSYYDKI